jgi:hypothetical protein
VAPFLLAIACGIIAIALYGPFRRRAGGRRVLAATLLVLACSP